MAEKLSTKEILARARAQAAQAQGGAAERPAPPDQPAQEAPAAPTESTETPAGEPPAAEAPAKAKSAPKGTAEILAAARAQAAGGPAQTRPRPPQSTKDILAAARAQAGQAPSAAEASVAAKAKPASAAARSATARAVGELPPVEEMVRAAREGRKLEPAAEAKPPAPVVPPIPTRPPPAKKPAEEPSRRSMLLALVATPFALAWTLLVVASGAFTLALARMMMPNVLIEPPTKFKVGPPSDYPFGTVSTKWTTQFGVWIVHTAYKGQPMIYALRSVCTHLGCTPNWLDGEQKFKCPCHGSGFYITGINFEGPAPRPLERVGIALASDGMLEVDKSLKFQEEMGQWQDPASFVVPPVV